MSQRNEVVKAKLVSGALKGASAGAGFAMFDLLLSGAVFAAEAAAAVAVESVIVSTVVTAAVVGGTGYGAYRLYKHATKA